MTREEKQKAIDALKISAPVMAVTQEEFNDYIQILNQVMDWLDQQSCDDWHDVPSDEMTLEQARQAVKDLRKKLAENLINQKATTCRHGGHCEWAACDKCNHYEPDALSQQPCEDCISRNNKRTICTDGLEEGIRCAMCTNPMANDRGCDGGCVVNESMYQNVLNVIKKQILEQEPCEDCISRQSIKRKLQEHHDFFIHAYGGFSSMSQNDKSRVDEIINCIAMVVNEPSVTPKEKSEYEHDHKVVKAYNDGQAYILDKLREEIEQDAFKDVNGSKYIFVNRINQIIDKYRGE